MPDVATVVRRWQDDAQPLLTALDETPDLGGWPTGEEQRRGMRALHALRACVCAQETAKERVLWPLVAEHLDHGEALEAAALDKKQHLEQLLLKMQWVDDRTAAMDRLLREFLVALREHMLVEVEVLAALEVLPPDRLPPDRLTEAGRKLLHIALRAATRPHPDLPPSPRLAVVLTPVVSLLDRMRDTLSPAPSGD